MYRSTVFLVSFFGVIGIAYSNIAHACIINRSVITGELQEVLTRDIKRKDIKKYHIILPKAKCFDLKGKKSKAVKHVKRIEIRPTNSTLNELSEIVGLKVSLRGDHYSPKSKAADLVVKQARIIGAYNDPRDGRFHHWTKLKSRLVKLKKNSEVKVAEKKELNEVLPEQERRYSSLDKKKLEDLIEQDRDPLGRNIFSQNEEENDPVIKENDAVIKERDNVIKEYEYSGCTKS